MKIALDTNVVVSAVATRGLCADLMAVILGEHDLVLGETVLAEVREVLARKLRVPRETIREFDALLRAQATIARAESVGPQVTLEATDARVLAEAMAAGAQVLVTGDKALLAVAATGIEVVSPRGLWDRLRSGPRGPRRAT